MSQVKDIIGFAETQDMNIDDFVALNTIPNEQHQPGIAEYNARLSAFFDEMREDSEDGCLPVGLMDDYWKLTMYSEAIEKLDGLYSGEEQMELSLRAAESRKAMDTCPETISYTTNLIMQFHAANCSLFEYQQIVQRARDALTGTVDEMYERLAESRMAFDNLVNIDIRNEFNRTVEPFNVTPQGLLPVYRWYAEHNAYSPAFLTGCRRRHEKLEALSKENTSNIVLHQMIMTEMNQIVGIELFENLCAELKDVTEASLEDKLKDVNFKHLYMLIAK